MKAKYQHEGNDCLIYDQIICIDNIVVTVRSYKGTWFDAEPEADATVYLTNAKARRAFYNLCIRCEVMKYECIYKEGFK